MTAAWTGVELKIFEPPGFEAFFGGAASFTEAPDITARICGICPVAYQMSAVHAMENALGVKVAGPSGTCAGCSTAANGSSPPWPARPSCSTPPDFLGYQDAIRMAQDHPDAVKMGLKAEEDRQRCGHSWWVPEGSNPLTSGWAASTRRPPKRNWRPWPKNSSGPGSGPENGALGGDLPCPEFEADYESSSPCVTRRNIPSTKGELFPIRGWIFRSRITTPLCRRARGPFPALHSRLQDRGPLFCPVPWPATTSISIASRPWPGKGPGRPAWARNAATPFQSIIVRAVETLYAVDEALASESISLRAAGATGPEGRALGRW